MVDMSAHFQEQFLSFDLNKIKDRVQDFSPVIQVVRDTWDHQTLGEILEGRVYLPDDVLNEMLAERVTGRENTPLSSLRLTCHENGIMDIDAMTKKGDKVELSGTIEKFIHKGDTSCLVYRVKKHRLPGHGISSWLFSQVSLGGNTGEPSHKHSAQYRHSGLFQDIGGIKVRQGRAGGLPLAGYAGNQGSKAKGRRIGD